MNKVDYMMITLYIVY